MKFGLYAIAGLCGAGVLSVSAQDAPQCITRCGQGTMFDPTSGDCVARPPGDEVETTPEPRVISRSGDMVFSVSPDNRVGVTDTRATVRTAGS